MHVARGSVRRLSYLRPSQSLTITPIQRQPRKPTFLSTAHVLDRPESTSSRPPSKRRTDNQETKSGVSGIDVPVFDFKSLGLNGPVRVVVIAVLCVLATIETVFYIKVGLRWWNGDDERRDGEKEDEAVENRRVSGITEGGSASS